VVPGLVVLQELAVQLVVVHEVQDGHQHPEQRIGC